MITNNSASVVANLRPNVVHLLIIQRELHSASSKCGIVTQDARDKVRAVVAIRHRRSHRSTATSVDPNYITGGDNHVASDGIIARYTVSIKLANKRICCSGKCRRGCAAIKFHNLHMPHVIIHGIRHIHFTYSKSRLGSEVISSNPIGRV